MSFVTQLTWVPVTDLPLTSSMISDNYEMSPGPPQMEIIIAASVYFRKHTQYSILQPSVHSINVPLNGMRSVRFFPKSQAPTRSIII